MTRSRSTAKQAGTRFERMVADYLQEVLEDDRIDRRVKSGAKDRGDITGVRLHGEPVVLECKDTTRTLLGPWVEEAEIERGNDDAIVGVVVHKRYGKGNPGEQFVTMTLKSFATMVGGVR